MGRVAGAALKIAAPEAAVAAGAAGKATGKARKSPVADPRQSHPGSEAARQRQAVEDVKAARKPEPQPEDEGGDQHEDQADEGGAGGGSLSSPFAGMQGPATGGGFVLGLMVWAVVRSYIGVTDSTGKTIAQGPAGVRMLLRAKFLNKTS